MVNHSGPQLNREGVFFGGNDLPARCGGRLFLQSELGGRPVSLNLAGTFDGVAKDFGLASNY